MPKIIPMLIAQGPRGLSLPEPEEVDAAAEANARQMFPESIVAPKPAEKKTISWKEAVARCGLQHEEGGRGGLWLNVEIGEPQEVLDSLRQAFFHASPGIAHELVLQDDVFIYIDPALKEAVEKAHTEGVTGGSDGQKQDSRKRER